MSVSVLREFLAELCLSNLSHRGVADVLLLTGVMVENPKAAVMFGPKQDTKIYRKYVKANYRPSIRYHALNMHRYQECIAIILQERWRQSPPSTLG